MCSEHSIVISLTGPVRPFLYCYVHQSYPSVAWLAYDYLYGAAILLYSAFVRKLSHFYLHPALTTCEQIRPPMKLRDESASAYKCRPVE
jgi:hypothetical protein